MQLVFIQRMFSLLWREVLIRMKSDLDRASTEDFMKQHTETHCKQLLDTCQQRRYECRVQGAQLCGPRSKGRDEDLVDCIDHPF